MKYLGNDPDVLNQFVQAVANGAISKGDPCIIESTGTVTVPSGSSQSQALGTAVTYESASAQYQAICYDSDAGKIIIAYRDGGNSSYGTAVVGTVSGNSITFGTPVVFESANTLWYGLDYDVNAQRVVIAYEDIDNNQYGTAVVGTVSGSSISFGSAVVFNSSATAYCRVIYDPTAQKTVIAYQDDGSASNDGMAIVGTVSGTSITFGTAVAFNSARTEEIGVGYDSDTSQVVISYANVGSGNGQAILGTVSGTSISFGTAATFVSGAPMYTDNDYDPVAGKFVVSYRDLNNSSYGTAVVGTVSGTSITYGTPVIYESALTQYNAIAYSTVSGKMVVAYKDFANSSRGTLAVGTVSGTSISFDTPVVFETGQTNFTCAVYDSAEGRILIAFSDGGNSGYGKALTFTPAYDTKNLTAENFIGFADNDYADGANTLIRAKGAVDNNQTSLTAGSGYYVQNDGTLSTTADDPSVFAGTAVSSTQIIVKG